MLDMEQIYQAHAQTVYRYLLSLTRDVHIAEELTQETFYRAVKNAEKFDGSCLVTTWLCAIAKNVLHSYRRSHPPTPEQTPADATVYSAEADLLAAENRVQLLQKLHALPDPAREVMYLRIFGQLSFRDICAALGKTENWARVTYFRAKEALRKELQQDEE